MALPVHVHSFRKRLSRVFIQDVFRRLEENLFPFREMRLGEKKKCKGVRSVLQH